MPDLLLVAAFAQRQGEAWHGMGGVQLGAGPSSLWIRISSGGAGSLMARAAFC